MSFQVYTSLVFLHIVFATLLVGSSLLTPLTRSAVRRASTIEAVRTVMSFHRSLTWLNPLATIVVLSSGFYLGTAGWMRQDWFWISVTVFLANGMLAGVGVKLLERGLTRSLEGAPSAPVPAEADRLRWSARWDLADALLLVNDLVVLLFMVRKPALGSALPILVGANAIAVLGALLARGRHARAAAPRAGAEALATR